MHVCAGVWGEYGGSPDFGGVGAASQLLGPQICTDYLVRIVEVIPFSLTGITVNSEMLSKQRQCEEVVSICALIRVNL